MRARARPRHRSGPQLFARGPHGGGSGGENIFPRRRKFCLLYTKSVHVVYKPHPSPRTHKRRVVLFLRRNNFA